MKQRWAFRIYPTKDQAEQLAQTFGCVRYVYNWGLSQRKEAYQRGEKMYYKQTSAALTQLKKQPETSWLNEVSSSPTQNVLRHLDKAYVNFFKKRAKYPQFKRKNGKQTAEYTGGSFRFDVNTRQLKINRVGVLKVKWSRNIEVNPSSVTIIRKPSGKYFVSLAVEHQPAPLPETNRSVGIDFGIAHLATLSTGEKIANPKYLNRYQKMMKRQQQSLSRKQKASNRRFKQKQRVAILHEKIANSRKDVANKLAWNLVTRFDNIYVEDLNLRGMVKNHKLARSLSDAGIGSAIRNIESKAAMHGKLLIKIDRWFPSSKMCSECGLIQESMPLNIREWTCDCGAFHDRDVNAARNIYAVGHTVSGRGDYVRQV